MESKTKNLHVVFLPFMAAGHMIPMLDIAKLFSGRHVKTTIITTPLNAPIFLKPLENYTNPNYPSIDVKIIPFPSNEADLPEGIENFEHFTTPQEINKFLWGCQKLEDPVEHVLKKLNPNFLIADFSLAFATRVAAKLNIPRLVFQGISFFANCVDDSLLKNLSSLLHQKEEFIIPDLPHEIKMKRSQIPVEWEHLKEFCIMAFDAADKSYGVIVNSFYDLESDYVNHFKNVLGKRAWDIGPVSLCNRRNETKFRRGKESTIDEHECLKWLDSKNPKSVLYMCFGSLSVFSASQLREIMAALEALGLNFIWVVGKIRGAKEEEEKEKEEEILNGFEKRMEGKGLIIRGWAPQILILEHESIGAFVTHCGWNSVLEAVSSGVPMVTWPLFAEQPKNEKLVTEVLKIGVAVGAGHGNVTMEGNVECESIKEAIRRVTIGEYRERVSKLKEMARRAVEEGGSSYSQLTSLIHELSSYKKA